MDARFAALRRKTSFSSVNPQSGLPVAPCGLVCVSAAACFSWRELGLLWFQQTAPASVGPVPMPPQGPRLRVRFVGVGGTCLDRGAWACLPGGFPAFLFVWFVVLDVRLSWHFRRETSFHSGNPMTTALPTARFLRWNPEDAQLTRHYLQPALPASSNPRSIVLPNSPSCCRL